MFLAPDWSIPAPENAENRPFPAPENANQGERSFMGYVYDLHIFKAWYHIYIISYVAYIYTISS